MGKKQKTVYEENARELALLSAYYPVDREKKLVTVDIQADNAGELLEEPAAPGFRGALKADFFEKCSEVISKFPGRYQLNVRVTVGQWGDLSPKELVRAVRDYVEISENTKHLLSRRTLFLSAIFVIVGFLILSLMFCGQNQGWFGDGLSSDLWAEVVDTAGTVFLWEAITVVVLEASEQSAADPGIRKKIAALTFCRPDGTELLTVSNRQLFHRADRSAQLRRIFRDGLLVSSCGFVVTGITEFLYIMQLWTWGVDALLDWGMAFICILSFLQILAGVGGFYIFWGRRNGFTRFAKAYAYCSLVLIALVLLVTLAMGSVWQALWMAMTFVMKLIFIISLLLDEKIAEGKQQEDEPDL